MAVSISAMARHWKVSRRTVQKRLAEGCPLDTIAAAEEWWRNRPKKRAATSGPNCKPAVEESQDIIELEAIPHADTGDNLQNALINSVNNERLAYAMVQNALRKQSSNMSSAVHVHTKTTETMLAVEKAVREEQERRGVLVEKQLMADMIRRAFEPAIRRMRKVAAERGPECSEADAIQSTKILQREMDNIISVMHKSLKDFGEQELKNGAR